MENIFVQVWTEIDPTLNVRVERRSGEPVADPGDVLQRVSPLGRAAVAAALAMSPCGVTAYSVGPGHRDALRHALAAGVSQAVELTSPADGGSPVGANAVAGWLETRHADLVIADRTAGRIAGCLGWAHLAGLDGIEVSDGQLRAVRHLDRGEREVVTARLPAVVRLQSESIRPPYIPRARILAVSPEAIRQEQSMGHEFPSGVEFGQLQVARKRTRFGGGAQSTSSRGMDRLAALIARPETPGPGITQPGDQPGDASPRVAADASPAAMADEFVRYLIHHDLLSTRKEE